MAGPGSVARQASLCSTISGLSSCAQSTNHAFSITHSSSWTSASATVEVAHRLVGVTGEGAGVLGIGTGRGVPEATAVGGEDLPVVEILQPAERVVHEGTRRVRRRTGLRDELCLTGIQIASAWPFITTGYGGIEQTFRSLVANSREISAAESGSRRNRKTTVCAYIKMIRYVSFNH